jgi:hypothetical protein
MVLLGCCLRYISSPSFELNVGAHLLMLWFLLSRTAGGAVKRYSGPSGGGSVNQGGIWRYYTDDAAGLKMSVLLLFYFLTLQLVFS